MVIPNKPRTTQNRQKIALSPRVAVKMSPYSVTKLSKGITIACVLCLVCVHFDQQRNSHAKRQQTLVVAFSHPFYDQNLVMEAFEKKFT